MDDMSSLQKEEPRETAWQEDQPMNKKAYILLKTVLIIFIVCMISATIFEIKLCWDLASMEVVTPTTEAVDIELNGGKFIQPMSEEITAPTLPEPEHVVSTATIGAMGDLLMHKPVFSNEGEYNSAVQQADGSFDFESVFRYLTEYTTGLDYAVINLETTLAGTTNGYPYNGYPRFNCPDEIVDGVKAAGFKMLLTANNHSYDTGLAGYKRTIEVIHERGLENLGTYSTADDTKWIVVDINGIKVGMLCYTYATRVTESGCPSLNDNPAISEEGICNFFTYGNLNVFYDEVEQYLAEMRRSGAEATIMFIHWGAEYQLPPNSQQKAIAQTLCDLGIDVIIGGHPHVVQPIELLESTVNPGHKTVCLFSMGNAVSNQRLGKLTSITTAHTEDGILFSVTFEKYSDGTVYLASIDAIPTWVNLHSNAMGKEEYNILPLDYNRINEWVNLFELGETTFGAAKNSYFRTMTIVESGLQEVKGYLNKEKASRKEYYEVMALNAA